MKKKNMYQELAHEERTLAKVDREEGGARVITTIRVVVVSPDWKKKAVPTIKLIWKKNSYPT